MTTTPRIALGLVLLSTTASANTVATDDGYASPPPSSIGITKQRVEGRVGMLIGGADVGDADGFSMGVDAGIGYSIGDLTLSGRIDYYKVGGGPDELLSRHGRATRAGGALRYSFANTGEKDGDGGGVGIDFWGEAGIGYEHVAWRQGGVLDRPSGELAVGFEIDGYGRRNARGVRRHAGYFMGFRTLLAQAPAMGETPATCGGPCTRPTPPSRTDLSMFFEMGLHWGR